MPRVRLTQPLTFNLTGYGRETIDLPAGEQDVPEVVASFVAANPAIGEVVPEAPAVVENPFPEDFPGRDALFEAGYSEPAEIPTDLADLVAIDGIGNKTAARILQALKDAGDNDDEIEDDVDEADPEEEIEPEAESEADNE